MFLPIKVKPTILSAIFIKIGLVESTMDGLCLEGRVGKGRGGL